MAAGQMDMQIFCICTRMNLLYKAKDLLTKVLRKSFVRGQKFKKQKLCTYGRTKALQSKQCPEGGASPSL